MKKILVLTLALALSLSLCACGASKTAETAEAEETAATVEAVTEAAEAAEATKVTVEASDPASSTKEPGVVPEKVYPPEGEKYCGMTAKDFANYCGCACVADLMIENETPYTFHTVLIAPSSSNSWGNDRLGSLVLYSGETFYDKLEYSSNNLAFDIRVETVDGDVYDWTNYYLGDADCSEIHLAFEPSGSNAMTVGWY